MHIAIVTQFGDNLGNKLQNYALQALLDGEGHSAETLVVRDGRRLHCPDSFGGFLGKFSPRYLAQVVSSRFKSRYPYKNERDGIWASIRLGKTNEPKRLNALRHEAFQRFTEEHLNVAKEPLSGGAQVPDEDYDAYICGSDQIWNPTYASTSGAYFLTFAPAHKRIAFAPSFGLSSIPRPLHPLYRRWLDGIPHLSVREEAGANTIRELTGREAPVLPDPTLCLTSAEWEKIERLLPFDTSPYVLTYFLGNETNRYRRYVERYAQLHGVQVINLFDLREPEHYAVGPSEFVWLVHHAKAMFTDSFHGTVFSLIFGTPFVVFDRVESGGMGMNSRLETLLKMTGIQGRRFPQVPMDAVGDIDFKSAAEAIQVQREKARVFLESALKAVAIASGAPQTNALPLNVQKHKFACSGCGACAQACPANCIRMVSDAEGFPYPVIQTDACLHCGRCLDLCTQSAAEAQGSPSAYVAYSHAAEIRAASSSGGLFSELATPVLTKGGVVYGAGFDGDFQVVHQRADSQDDLTVLRGSKYVQSQLSISFEDIKHRLEAKQWVYFSGTPCQVDGLLAYLVKDYPTLLTQDILCHGVTSPAVWKEYLAQRTHRNPIWRVSFRDKTYGWHYFSLAIETGKNKYVRRLDEDGFLRLFLDNVILRPSCYTCRHKHLHRKADFTIGDAWALRSMKAGVKDDDRGLSLLFVNTAKGREHLESIKARLAMMEVPFEQAAQSQTAMTQSVPYNQNRDLFFATAEENGLKKTLEEWFGFDLPQRLKAKWTYLKTKCRKIISQ